MASTRRFELNGGWGLSHLYARAVAPTLAASFTPQPASRPPVSAFPCQLESCQALDHALRSMEPAPTGQHETTSVARRAERCEWSRESSRSVIFSVLVDGARTSLS